MKIQVIEDIGRCVEIEPGILRLNQTLDTSNRMSASQIGDPI
eukprot:CAMPEP_0202014360 /NCGR_PEP_ID=MMETSP0905-20130828/28866_1 /ASSEMBLY_ACC=CAM_ASM_000554 /TAXON_ID=420261 /ORGANISM="Thalassiosira antarctica, Strain CCMP982" /LENGTH=41 /DNA_ID= /DNA_START= /DNA_END= /DNA_ORIENTATION=